MNISQDLVYHFATPRKLVLAMVPCSFPFAKSVAMALFRGLDIQCDDKHRVFSVSRVNLTPWCGKWKQEDVRNPIRDNTTVRPPLTASLFTLNRHS